MILEHVYLVDTKLKNYVYAVLRPDRLTYNSYLHPAFSRLSKKATIPRFSRTQSTENHAQDVPSRSKARGTYSYGGAGGEKERI